MKKLYTLALGAAVALSASALTVGNLQHNSLMQLDNQSQTKTALKAEKVNANLGVRPAKAPAKAEATDEWKDLGKGKMQDCFIAEGLADFIEGLEAKQYEVAIQQNVGDENTYRVLEPFAGVESEFLVYDAAKAEPMVLHVQDGLFYMEDFCTGLSIEGLDLYISTQIGSMVPSYGFETCAAAFTDCLGNFADGVFTYPAIMQSSESAYYNFLLWAGDPDAETSEILGGCNTEGTFKVVLPGAKDYSLEVAVDQCVATDPMGFYFNPSSDLAKVKYYVGAGRLAASDANFELVAGSVGDELPAGTTAFGMKVTSLGETSAITLLAVGLDAEDKVVAKASAIGYYLHNQDADYEDMGMGTYNDDLAASFYSDVATEPYQVMVQKHKTTAGLYRLVEPYGTAWEMSMYNSHPADDHQHHLYIDAQDAAKVNVLESVLGIDLGDGVMVASSQINLNSTASDLVKKRYYGSYDEATRTITFPAKALVICGLSYNGGGWYTANNNTAFSLTLPETEGVNDIVADSDMNASVEYFNLQGQAIQQPAAGQLVIRRQGNTVSKVVVK